MSYKTLLTHVQNGPAGAAALQAAVDIAGDLGATLIGLGSEMIPPSGVADPTGLIEGEWVKAMREQIEKNLDEAEQQFNAAASGAPNIWLRSLELPARALARAARAADLILVGRTPHPLNAFRDCDVGELAITAGRPVLVAPSRPQCIIGTPIYGTLARGHSAGSLNGMQPSASSVSASDQT